MRLSEMRADDIAITMMENVKNLPSKTLFEETAQLVCEKTYNSFSESIVLTRIFVTRPLSCLPKDITDFVWGLGEQVGITDQILDDSPILSLAGTKGKEHAWSDRKLSGGHKGIPLVSSDFVSAVPMLMGVFKQTLGDLSWLNMRNRDEMHRITGKSTGIFYVENAKKNVDDQGRKIIAAQDFVKKEDISTVFGIAGGLADGSMMVMLNFTREELDKSAAEAFVPAIMALRSRAVKHVFENRVFHDSI